MENIAWFSDISKKDVAIAGGKGCNLGEMYNIKLPIPSGFVITAQAYKKFLEETNLKNKINNILKPLNAEDTGAIHDASKKIQEMVMDVKMPESIKSDILEAYDTMNVHVDVYKALSKSALSFVKAGRDQPFVAVRSSATAEDLPSISEDDHVFVKLNNNPIYCKVKELYSMIGDAENCNLEVPSMKENKLIWTKVGVLYKHPVEGKKLYKIITDSGREITISKKHSLIKLDKDNLSPKISSIDEIKKEDLIPVVSTLPKIKQNLNYINILDFIKSDDIINLEGKIIIKNNSGNSKIQNPLPNKINLDNDFLYFLGLYVAEGCTYKKSVILTNSNKEVREPAINFLKSINLYKNQKINKNSVRVYCKTLARFLEETTGKPLNIKGKGRSCRIKRVPNFIFGLNNQLIGRFLRGCFDGDGYISKKGIIQYTSTSDLLAGGVAKLLELLGINLYINRKNNSININIPLAESAKFRELISFNNKNKLKRLDKAISFCKLNEIKQKTRQNLEISNILCKKIRNGIENKLEKRFIEINSCPLCYNKISRSSRYKHLIRYYCPDCKKSFYKKYVIKEKKLSYVYYDEKGRFKEGITPWNKGLIRNKCSLNKLNKFLSSYDLKEEFLHYFNGDIKWERIKEIKEMSYDGWVYDFTVPDVENFVAGIGGIITHNTASFAGQQKSFMNIKGIENLIYAVQECWASLFTARAIYYRIKNNFEHEKVLIAVVVQKMINSDASGVIFTINPSTNNEDEIVIEAGYGLGDAIVGGEITPDEYIIDKKSLTIKSIKVNKQLWCYTKDERYGNTIKKNISETKGSAQKLIDELIIGLAKYAKQIEDHYGKAMDIEYAVESGRLFIVQARPVTTQKKVDIKKEEQVSTFESANILLTGMGASPGIVYGPVKLIHSIKDLDKIQKGDILVATMTNPDYVPSMEKAAAIVTNEGGVTAHAAIVSRELGVPCVVGTLKATEILKDNQLITVDGTNGKIYNGKIEITAEKEESKVELIEIGEAKPIKTKIYMNLGEPDKIDKYKDLPFDGIGLMRLEFLIATEIGEHPNYLIEIGQQNKYIEKLAWGISKVASTIKPRPVIVRFSDFKTNEYHDLKGGEKYEPKEDNPLMGWRGVSRYVSDDFKEAFKLECKAIKKVRDSGLNNVWVMLPFVRTIDEVKKCLDIMKEEGLEQNDDFKIWLMAEVPSMVLLAEEFAQLPISGCSIGSNDLSSLILAVDRDSAILGRMGYFDEKNPAVLKAIKILIGGFKKYGKSVSLCGQAGSTLDMAKLLVGFGITSISVNPDAVAKIRQTVASIEKN